MKYLHEPIESKDPTGAIPGQAAVIIIGAVGAVVAVAGFICALTFGGETYCPQCYQTEFTCSGCYGWYSTTGCQ